MTERRVVLRLSVGQRKALFAGECPHIGGWDVCPVVKGDELRLSSEVWVEVLSVKHTDKLDGSRRRPYWSLHYRLVDNRDPARLVRRTPPAHRERVEMTAPTEDVIARAGQESGYTSSARSQVAGAGEAVPAAVQRRLTEEAKTRKADHRKSIRKDQARLVEEARIVEYMAEARTRKIDVRSERKLLDRLLEQGKPATSVVVAIRKKLDQDLAA